MAGYISLSRIAYLFAYLALTLASAWIFLWNIGAHSISLRSDEVIYVRVTQSILHNGDLFPLMHGNTPTFEKPPLKLWLAALAPMLLGESNLAFRVLDGLLGVATVLLSVALMRRISGSAWLGLLSGVLLLGMPELVISHHGFRRAVLDGLLTVLTLLIAFGSWRILESRLALVRHTTGADSAEMRNRSGFWACSKLDRERAWAIAIGAMCSLAVLTKSVAGFVPALCALISLLVSSPHTPGRIYPLMSRRRALLWIVLLPALTCIGYCIALWCVAGQKALNIFIGVEVLTRVFSGFEGHNTGDPWFYLRSLFVRGAAVPRVLLFVGVLGTLITLKKNRALRFLLVWAALPVTIYSCSASKVPWYLNPFLPFISMVAILGTAALLTSIFKVTFKVLGDSRGRALAPVGMRCAVALLAIASLPAFMRAVYRHVDLVVKSNQRIEIDLLVESLRSEYSQFVIVENALSGRSNPRNGRFNVEGIYREMLKPELRVVSTIEELAPRTGEVLLVKEESLTRLPPGWRQIGLVNSYFGRAWRIVALVYD